MAFEFFRNASETKFRPVNIKHMYTLLHVSIDVFFDMYVEMLDFFDVLIINLLYICEKMTTGIA